MKSSGELGSLELEHPVDVIPLSQRGLNRAATFVIISEQVAVDRATRKCESLVMFQERDRLTPSLKEHG